MRLLALRLLRFGPFADVALDFSAEPAALHVIYGPNEAGKSTALRAIAGVLFGIPERTGDAHRHPMHDLRIGARLTTGEGAPLEVVRKKGRKATLLSPDGEPLDEAPLLRALGGVSASLFQAMYGLDHVSLREGGEALLRGHGDVGQSLHAAAVGGRGTSEVLRTLRGEADALYRPRGKNQRLNRALRGYLEAKRATNRSATSAAAWLTQRRAIEHDEREHAERLSQRHALVAEQSRLERALRVLPHLAKRRQLLGRVEALGAVVPVPDDTTTRRTAAVEARNAAGAAITHDEDNRDRLRARLVELGAGDDVDDLPPGLAQRLQSELGRHRSAATDRARLEGKARAMEQEIALGLRRLGHEAPHDVGRLRVATPLAASVRALATRHGALASAVAAARRALEEDEARLRDIEQRLSAHGRSDDASALRDAVARARRHGDLDGALAEADEQLRDLERRAAEELMRLPDAGACLDEVRQRVVPDRATVDRFAAQLRDLDARQRALDEQRRARAQLRDGAAREIDLLRRAGDVPTPQQLAEARSARDALLDGWLEAPSDATAVRRAVADADRLADRLWREADRVAQIAALESTRDGAEAELRELDRALAQAQQDHATTDARWRRSWAAASLEPGAPEEMRAWLERFEALREQAQRIAAAAERRTALTTRAEQHRREVVLLLEALPAPLPAGAALGAVLDHAERVVQATTLAATERQQLTARAEELRAGVAEHQRELRRRQEALSEWQSAWRASMTELGVRETASPEEAMAMLDGLTELFRQVDELGSLRRRIAGIDRDAETFAALVGSLVAERAPELGALAHADAAERILSGVRRAQAQQAERERLRSEIAERQAALDKHRRRRDDAEVVLGALMAQTGVGDLAALELAEQRAAEARQLRRQLDEVEDTLLQVGEGSSLEELVALAAPVSADEAHARLRTVRDEIAELNEHIDRLSTSLGGARRGLEHLEQGTGAGEAAGDAAHWLAEVVEHAEQYICTTLACRVLEQEIERFRAQNQGPVLTRASALVSALTLGSVTGLSAELDDDGAATLRCLRPGGERVGVEALSDGARDQLYLALRLATLERQADAGHDMPLVLDDVLVHFDDDRATAALAELARFATRSQVLLFTHHEHVVELARAVASAGRVVVHTLGGT